jgi:hypothetical protein
LCSGHLRVCTGFAQGLDGIALFRFSNFAHRTMEWLNGGRGNNTVSDGTR